MGLWEGSSALPWAALLAAVGGGNCGAAYARQLSVADGSGHKVAALQLAQLACGAE